MATLSQSAIKKRRIKKLKIVLIITVCELIISPYIAYIFHQVLNAFATSNYQLAGISYNFIAAYQEFIVNEKVRQMFIIVQFGYIIMLLYSLFATSLKLQKVETRIVAGIEVPIAVGNGQHGTSRFQTEDEKEEVFEKFIFTGKEISPPMKGGVVVQMIKKGSKEIILYVSKQLHTLIIGSTGAGKTRRILFLTIWMQLMSGISIVASDVKGEIYYFTHKFAEMLGYKTLAIDLRNPRKSVHYNFMQQILDSLAEGDKAQAIDYTWDLVSVLVGEQKGEPLWYNGETATIAASILIVAIDAPRKYRNLTNVYYFIAYMCESNEYGEMPLNEYLKKLPDTHPAKGVFAMAKIAPGKTRSSFFTSALGTLKLFTNPNVAEMTSKSDFNIKDIGKEKTFLYMIIPDEKKTLYPLCSILITQLYVAQVELANENGLKLPVNTDYDLDEVGNFPKIPILPNLLSAGRSRGIRANLIIQDYQQLETKYKDDFKTIKSSCQVKIYLKSDDPDTLKTISQSLGKYTVQVNSASTSVSDNNKSNNTNYSQSSNMAGRELLMPDEVGRIKSPYALCMVTGEFPSVTKLPDLSEYKLNQIWGLGNEEHNTKIMVEREKEREERSVGEIELWGIWNKYIDKESDSIEYEVPEPNKKRVSFLDLVD